MFTRDVYRRHYPRQSYNWEYIQRGNSLSLLCNLAISTKLALALSQSEGLTLETSALQLVTVANLHFQLS